MVRRGSTVRVRQRALQKPRKVVLLFSPELARSPVCTGYGALYGAFRSRSRFCTRRQGSLSRPTFVPDTKCAYVLTSSFVVTSLRSGPAALEPPWPRHRKGSFRCKRGQSRTRTPYLKQGLSDRRVRLSEFRSRPPPAGRPSARRRVARRSMHPRAARQPR